MDYVTKVAEMVSMLPPSEQNLAFEMVKRLVLAWDPDFTKLTPSEAAELREAEQDRDGISLEEYMREMRAE